MSRLPIKPRVVAFALYLFIVGGLLTLILVQTMTATGERRRLLQEVAELEQYSARQVDAHRHANQTDHDNQNDCLVALSRLLVDPARDRNSELIPPPACIRGAK